MGVRRNLKGDAGRIGCLVAPIAVPAGPVGCVGQIAVDRYRDGDTCVFCRSEPTHAFPARSVERIAEISVCRYFDGHAVATVRPISRLAFPASSEPRVRQVSVWWHVDDDAFISFLSLSAVTFPRVALARTQIRIRRRFYRQARLTCFPKAPAASPAAPIGRIGRISIGWYIDLRAEVALFSETPIALPSAPKPICARILGNLVGVSLSNRRARPGRQEGDQHYQPNASEAVT